MHTSRARRSVALAIGLFAIAATGCGGDDGDRSPALSFEQYFASFGYDYEPAKSLAELADRSEIVVLATLTDVVEGPRFGESWDDPFAERNALFVFESPALAEPILVPFPYPIEIGDRRLDASDVRAVMPLGARAVIHVVQQAPPNDPSLWHGRDPNVRYYTLTTPQGFALERAAEVGDQRLVQLPVEHEPELAPADAPRPGAPLEDWLPPSGEKIPAELRAAADGSTSR